ncbi:hypothetical protein [Ruegeria sp. HKCCD8929]|uniref:hypothetical protein n=1 Tax=Ruegeria sp. HKCCD8929 TaxID=2683006 RepID=UPI0020C4DFD2|nr:hypothetical protein [Ruegeria sp. HKCCD8929]
MRRSGLTTRFLPFLLMVFLLWPAMSAAQNLFHSGSSPAPSSRDEPLEVAIGIHIDQIVEVNQKSENYRAVATIRAEWRDPALAFDEAEFGSDVRIFKPEAFTEHALSLPTIAPAFVIQNQQSNRWIHQSVVAVWSDGRVRYLEKSSLTLQAPHFNFRKYPFDKQRFYFEIVSVYPSDMVTYTVLEDDSGLGSLLGEEEWILEKPRMQLSKATGLSGMESDMVALAFEGRRHVMYYVIRIFLPMVVLIVVSWTLFFLDEYRKRIEIAGANLLVFVAFNWAVSDDLPKLGYLTFLDFILQWMFVVTGAIIAFNVILRRMKVAGREALAVKLDNYAVKWIYPLAYVAIVGFAVGNYLVIH